MKTRSMFEEPDRMPHFLQPARSIVFKATFLGIVLVFVGIALDVFFDILPCYRVDAFEGRVVDIDTQEPIVGAVVLVIDHRVGVSPAGSRDAAEDWREALTDDKGEFHIPKSVEWFGARRGHLEGKVEIFKPGYGTLWHERANAIGVNKSWPPPGRFIIYTLPRLETREERMHNLSLRGFIAWQKCPHYLKLYNEESIYLGQPPLPGDPAQDGRRRDPALNVIPGHRPLPASPGMAAPGPVLNR